VGFGSSLTDKIILSNCRSNLITAARKNCWQRTRLGDVAVFENRQPVTAAKFITKNSLFILLLGVIRRLVLKMISELGDECLQVTPPYSQTACWLMRFMSNQNEKLNMQRVKQLKFVLCGYQSI
jgi:hypothetical protein